MNSEQWLKERTFHHSNFWDIKWLVEEKQRQGLSISLCLPTLNEARTIGQEIVILKGELKDRYPLVDEIAVVDSGSTDETCQIASSFGADVYIAEEHLTEAGAQRGKGENLWKASTCSPATSSSISTPTSKTSTLALSTDSSDR